MKLHNLGKELNSVFASAILMEISYYLIGSIVSLYGISGIMFYQVNIFRFSFCLLCLFSSAQHILHLYFTCKCGQDLEDQRQRSRLALKRFYRRHGIELSRDDGRDYDDLLDHLQESKIIAPYSLFSLGHSCFVEALATGITYLIVLMQFKVSESA